MTNRGEYLNLHGFGDSFREEHNILTTDKKNRGAYKL